LSNNSDRIRIEEALIIIKSITDDPLFPEEDIYDILDDNEVNVSRKLNQANFIKLIEVIKKKQN